MSKRALLTGLLFAGLLISGCDDEGEKKSERSGGSNGTAKVASDQVLVQDSSYVSPLTEVFGDVFVGQSSFVVANTVLRAAPNDRVELGDRTNIQDNALVRARQESTIIGDRTSLAHHAIVRDSRVGDFVFLGMGAEVVDSTVGDDAFILHGAFVEGVDIPKGALVEAGRSVTTQAAADALPQADESTEDYRRDLLEVNTELADGYVALFESGDGYERVIDVGPNPETSFNKESVEPRLGEGVIVEEFARIVGDVRIGDGSRIAQRTTMRADEGTPIVVGENADIEDRVSFHALEGTEVRVGDDFTAADDAVIHGPLQMGDGVSVEERAVVFRADVEDNVQIGDGALIFGPAPKEDGTLPLRIPEGTVIPEGAVITSPEDLEDFIR